jgi:hypothetical protein
MFNKPTSKAKYFIETLQPSKDDLRKKTFDILKYLKWRLLKVSTFKEKKFHSFSKFLHRANACLSKRLKQL